MIEEVLGTTIGDANLDGRFDSSDLILVLSANEYEDSIPLNSTWAEGDWNADGEFTSRDIVAAFMTGAYEGGAMAATGRVTAPSSHESEFATARGDVGATNATERTRTITTTMSVELETDIRQKKMLELTPPQAIDASTNDVRDQLFAIEDDDLVDDLVSDLI